MKHKWEDKEEEEAPILKHEDRQRVVYIWRALGVRCAQVVKWEEVSL